MFELALQLQLGWQARTSDNPSKAMINSLFIFSEFNIFKLNLFLKIL